MTNARLALSTGYPSSLSPRRRPFRVTNRARSSRAEFSTCNASAGASVGSLASSLWLRGFTHFVPSASPSASRRQTPDRSFSQNMIRPTGAGRTKRWQIFDGMSKRRHIKSCALHSCLRNPLVLRHRLPLISTALFLQAVGSALVVVLNFSRSSRVCSRRSGGNFSTEFPFEYREDCFGSKSSSRSRRSRSIFS